MTPPKSAQANQDGLAGDTAPAVFVHPLEILRKRRDFLAANKGRRQSTAAFTIQARKRSSAEPDPDLVRIGFTCSKKVGNAVARNRAKRRLRELARTVLPVMGQAGWDYVLIGRRDTTATRPFDQMLADLQAAIDRLHPVRS